MRTLAVVPAYQAERSVGQVVSSLQAAWPAASGPSVLVVDDGSTDGTAEQARAAGAELVRHPKNCGKGAALRSGFQRALELGAAAVVTVDADGQHLADEAVRLALHPAPWDALVLGVRDLKRDGAPKANRISNGISNAFLSWFGGRALHDTQCGLRRYPIARTLALGAGADGYAFEAEVVLRAARAGWTIVQVPVRVYYPPEHERVSHFHAVYDPARIVGRVLVTMASPRGHR